MTIEEIRYRLQAMVTMCTFQDAVGHDLSQKEMKLYNQAKDEAIETMRKYQQIEQILKDIPYGGDVTVKGIYAKADMVAMLEQLDSEIQEQIAFMGDGEETNGMKRADKLVKDKINALKQSIWQDNYNGKKETNNG